ncbi:MAG: AP4A hydrolase [Candidatus Beckwithbacteria bacterium GW2011_GWB1_47_15]|uniref:AP4A hydrolase n=1 Tax=Candidatus Beckwithbacteria bacterium GW2011_GWB1_47_15 TaxID=1618371 RepID=A0A0G1RU73_9BACT|nr:MAG: AP4A hydrolase [Candidatus Beckwithbacteria bacterium GW2011_GWC1_49_16]KKU34633.1 MAG: AP4A hydrolase [Candidatus Beckwithbacteria bacterium GW2011_GWA1_46_30]KKU60672.1 MAG: AP4A hydrolase [Candidatus Beckwithbacteria bacterium GW2011_GWB1_47_15]KKU71210.1 MAG: AP4A hydrolase [Candidatus Beckwithbacteria bacterium GW2011_GWA2_47_25]KKW03100.1 MAG: AP4A hydrolase [Candidatus Beckwithbacteria bacterium GW2011_GWC2_49_11]OGD48442.1 MAG: hypothetical protein A2877_03305 [Candidatus Beckw
MKSKSRREFSAGGVVYRKLEVRNSKHETVWLVCKHSGYHRWVLPKGLVEKGESLKDTAVREVEEECGVRAKVIAKIPEPERYVYTMAGQKVFKLVTYFLMEYQSGNIKDHSWEMEEVEWLEFDQAVKRVEFKGAKEVLEKAKKIRDELKLKQKLI